MNRQIQKEPMLNLEEPAPVIFAGILILVHALTVFVPSLGNYFKEAFALAAYDGNALIAREIGSVPTLLTHVLVHANWTHVLQNSVFIAIFGILVMRGVNKKNIPVLGRLNRAVLVFFGLFLAGAIAGGLAEWLMWIIIKPSGWVAAFGASTSGSTMFAALGWVLGGRPRMMIFLLIVVAMDAFTLATGGNIAWAGHLGGYLAGMALAPLWLKPESVGINLFR